MKAEWIRPILTRKHLEKELKEVGVKAKIMPIEIGTRRYPESSSHDIHSKFSICGNRRNQKLQAKIAQNSCRLIWSWRNETFASQGLTIALILGNLVG
ncbi:hypothetical protein ElyMa_003236000 [Elysia marginata]|uniref:Uncharacterized protein n=1 Tax=Elysia marginata TaxID=1093978 RepID=A0AAV4J5V1_9GAST|nr:hypothetical protein ElyMa_003236000 [Elysia marginata]